MRKVQNSIFNFISVIGKIYVKTNVSKDGGKKKLKQ